MSQIITARSLDVFGALFSTLKNHMVYPHFQPLQPNALRQLNSKQAEAKRSKWSSTKMLTRAFSSSAWQVTTKFGKHSSIHGMNRLLDESSGKYEKLIWLCTLVLAFCGSIYICLLLSDRFNEGKFETVVESTREPVYRIFFPVVTICNLNRLNWQRLPQAKKRFLPNETSSEKLQLFERIVGAYDDLQFGNFDKFAVLQDEPLHLLNHINFSLVFDFMTWNCDEFLTKCTWKNYPLNCCEIFSRRRSKSGYCWSFNTLETVEGRSKHRDDPQWPLRTGNAGPTTGLRLRVLINPDKHYTKSINEKGISVMITEPYAWHDEPFIIPENTQSTLEIEPVIYFYDNKTRRVPSTQRQCVFDDEQNSEDYKSLEGYVYMLENCQSECHQEYLMRYCNCSIDLMFPPEHFRYSQQPGEEKYVRHRHHSMVCKCYRSCFSLDYMGDVHPSHLPPEMVTENSSYVDLDVYYRFDSMMLYRTRLVFGWMELLVSFGGIVGLFLGCSLISVIELAYFGLIELPNCAFSELKLNWKQQRADKKKPRKFTIQNRVLAPNHLGNFNCHPRVNNYHGRVAAWNQLNLFNFTEVNVPRKH